MIVNRLQRLRRAEEDKQGRKLTYDVLAAETGLSYSTVARLVAGQTERIDFETLNALCRYFHCSVGDIFEYVED